MPLPSQVHVNAALTDVSLAYKQKRADFIFDQVFPTLPVAKQTDFYWTFDKKDWMRAMAELRAPGTESAGISHKPATATYGCKPYALHEDVTDQERANADAVFNSDSDASENIMAGQLNRAETIWATNYFTTGKWGTDAAGAGATNYGANQVLYWDNTASDPIADVEYYRTSIKLATGMEPNTLVVGRRLWSQLKNHPAIIARVVYNGQGMRMGTVTREAIAAILEVDRLLIASAVNDVSNWKTNDTPSTTGTPQFIVSNDSALLTYAAPRPGIKTPSGGYTFVWKGLLGTPGIVTSKFRMEHLKSDRIETEFAFDSKLIAADLGVFFDDLLT